jgi:hypothetical protein
MFIEDVAVIDAPIFYGSLTLLKVLRAAKSERRETPL